MIKTLALLFVSIGLCLHIYSTYDSLLLAGLLYVSIAIVDAISIAFLWPYGPARRAQLKPAR
jgi:hypothetical protein